LSIELVGWAALILTQVFWVPNILRIVRTRDVDGYSLPAWTIMATGLACWLVYFASKGDVVGMVANICGVTGAGITLGCIWYWGRSRVEKGEALAAGGLGEPLTTDQG
jgi:MtN3 and saliva related transmembrane protein